MTLPALMSIQDIAAVLRLNPAHVRDRLVKRPDFPRPAINEPRFRRWRAAAIDRWISEQEKLSNRGSDPAQDQ
jgi:predicted DNA-binding transcriptional regulator AlpA